MKEIELKEIQKISLEILYEISQICEKEKLTYNLMYGTLLGCIRHKGFIPWDDDVDIMMPRKDYEKLLEYLEKNPTRNTNLKVFNNRTCPEYPYMITRISDDRYVIKTENESSYGLGVFIDIYPFDGLGNTESEAFKFGIKGDILSSMCFQSTRNNFTFKNTDSYIKKIFKYPLYIYSKFRGKEYFQRKLSRLAEEKDYEKNKYVGCVTWLSGGMKDIFLSEWFDETIFLPFEKYQFRVPKLYNEVLEHIYDDYMELPAEEDRIGHHYYKVYKK